MTKYEARGIEDLQISPNELEEDLFYWELAGRGIIPDEHAKKAIDRMKTYTDEIPQESLQKVKQMVDNVEKYGVACYGWCKG